MKTRIIILLAALLGGQIQIPLQAAPGDVDLSFDPGSSVDGFVSALVVQSDGKILVGGGFTTVHGALRRPLARLNPDGTVDTSFSPMLTSPGSTYDYSQVNGIALQPDGKIICCGVFAEVNGLWRTNLARLNPDGTLDAAFLSGQIGLDGSGRCVALQPDGKILIAGDFTLVNGLPQPGLARLNSDGTLDESFLVNGLGGINNITCITLQADGKILVGGPFISINGIARTNVARLNNDGTLDTSFLHGLDGPAYPDNAGAHICGLAVQPDGRILVGGRFCTFNGVPCTNLARLNVDGTLDQSFTGPATMPPCPAFINFALQTDGKILVGVSAGPCGPNDRLVLCRLNADGSQDPSFSPDLPHAYGAGGVTSLALDGNGKVLAAGGDIMIHAGNFLCRLTSTGARDGAFGAPSGPDSEVFRVATQSNGQILIAGRFRSVNGVPRGHLARLMADGSLDASFLNGMAGTDGDVRCMLLQEDGKVVIGGEFRSVNGVERLGIARLNTDGSLDASFVNDLSGYVYALGWQDGKIIAGGANRAKNLARLNPDGSTDTSFLSDLGSDVWGVQCLALQPNGKILIGGFFGWRVLRLNPDGSRDSSFGANVDQAVLSLAVQADGKVLIGGFFNTPRQWFARLNPDGSSDYSFNPAWQGGSVYAVALQNDGKIYVGGQGYTRLVRLNPDGSADPSFTTTWPAQDGVVWCVLPLPDGRVFLSGGFTAINQTARAFVARLAGDYSPAMILQDPVSQTAESGSQVVFKVRASGAPPLSYQWCFQGSAPITGASTAAGYCITNVQAAHSGAYTVIVSNLCGAVTSAPAFLNVISPVERRPVPRIRLAGQPGLRVALSYATALTAPLVWIPLDQVVLTNTPQFYFDLTSADGLPRFYRAAHTNSPAPPVGLDLRLVPQVTLNGPIGSSVRVDCINQFGPIDAWVTLDTVSLATQPQYYYDVTAPDNPPRLYRLVSMP